MAHRLRQDDEVIRFNVDPSRKHCPPSGLDENWLTRQKADKIVGCGEKARPSGRPRRPGL